MKYCDDFKVTNFVCRHFQAFSSNWVIYDINFIELMLCLCATAEINESLSLPMIYIWLYISVVYFNLFRLDVPRFYDLKNVE